MKATTRSYTLAVLAAAQLLTIILGIAAALTWGILVFDIGGAESSGQLDSLTYQSDHQAPESSN